MISELKGTVGIIHSIDTTNYTAKVQLPEYNNEITEDLQILSPITFGNKITSIPKVNTPVFCIFLGDRTDRGFIIGSYFSDINLSESKENQCKLDFKGSTLTIKEDGNIELTGTLTKIDSNVLITGDTTIEKNLTVSKDTQITNTLNVKVVNYKELNKV